MNGSRQGAKAQRFHVAKKDFRALIRAAAEIAKNKDKRVLLKLEQEARAIAKK